MVAGGWDREAPLGAVWLPPLPFSEQDPLHSPSPAGPRIRGSSCRHNVSRKRPWAVAVPGEPREAPGTLAAVLTGPTHTVPRPGMGQSSEWEKGA